VFKIKHIIVKLHKLFYKYQLMICNTFSFNISNNKKVEIDIPIIVSLTTYPDRLNIVYLAIESIIQQTLKPEKIILWLSRQEIGEQPLPKKILKQEKRGLKIKFVDENLRSYNKLYYALHEYPQSYIVTIDDDTIYPRWLLENLYKKHIQFPKAIVAYRTIWMTKKNNNSLTPYIQWKDTDEKGPHLNIFPTGVGGILYPPKSLNKEVLNKTIFLEDCPLADDVWFKAMALLNDIPTVKVYKKSIEFSTIGKSQTNTLHHINLFKSKNDEQIAKVFQRYGLFEKIS